MEQKLRELKERLLEIDDLKRAYAVLEWDQSTYLPSGGAESRGRHLATLARLAQEKFVEPAIGKLLDALQPYADSLPYDSDEASLVRLTRREYERAIRIPPAFVGELSNHNAQTYQVWTEARPANDFARLRPLLEKTLDYSRRLADFFPGYEHIIDPLVDAEDYGMKASTLKALFADLRKELVPIVQAITSQPPADDSCLRRHYPHAAQLAICQEIGAQVGYDFQRGRLDLTHHPFETSFGVGDVRITVRVKEEQLLECLYGVLHEGGHGMYEQGVHPNLEGTPLGAGSSAGVHESQSRLWENVVGRSREFCEYAYPRLQAYFPMQLGALPLEKFYKGINKVEPSLIRVEADEATYNLHIMLRLELEIALVEGSLEVKDLPEAWNARMQDYLGLTPPNDALGVMQDIHWSSGYFGYFSTYALGNLIASQLWERIVADIPDLTDQIRRGEFAALLGWLREKVHRHGRKFEAQEMVQRITGSKIDPAPYLRYLQTKYSDIYGF